MIALEHVCKTYKAGGVTALQDVSFTIEDGEIFGIIGLSGAGKSTLVRCLNRLEAPSSGRVTVDGQDLASLSGAQLRALRRRIGMIFQHFCLLSQRTVLQNVLFPLQIAGTPRAAAQTRARELLALVGLQDRLQAYPAQLSGGQKQRVAIARALACEPGYLLCDEATSALDPETTDSILTLLKKINRELGVTVVVITHEMRVIETICDRVAVLDQSRLAELAPVAQLFTAPRSEIARRLILPGSRAAEERVSGGKKIRLQFCGERSEKPVIANMVLACQAPVSILAADTREINGRTYGYTVLRLPQEEKTQARLLAWLQQNHNTFTLEEDAG